LTTSTDAILVLPAVALSFHRRDVSVVHRRTVVEVTEATDRQGRTAVIDAKGTVQVALQRGSFDEKEREVTRFDDISVSAFRYKTGIEAVRLSNRRGHVVVLPFMGQMVWSATFDGVDLAMTSMFPKPRPARTIVETYGCLAYHSGLLRNGVPSSDDDHPPHGEAPCADMDDAGLVFGTDGGGWVAVTGTREYAMGFGAHYRAKPSVTLRRDKAGCKIAMEVQNLSAAPMELMYMCHVNFAFADGARIVQPVPFTPEHVVARISIPSHVNPTPQYRALIDAFAANPARLSVLNESPLYDPEQVFYITGLKRGRNGLVHFMLMRREGDAFGISWDPDSMPHCVRWILDNKDQRVAAFAMPATCEPEGYTAEKRKGNVRFLTSGMSAEFTTNIAFFSKDEAGAAAAEIEGTTR
jgi:hypothetical protein